MTRGFLRPVGERIPLRRDPSARHALLEQARVLAVDSGTSALALALRAAAVRAGRERPSALLPAYACPDLIAAAVWAGVEPRLLDVRDDFPFPEPSSIERAIDADVVAIVAADFLGVRIDLAPLRSLADAAGIVLIEDAAQWFPSGQGDRLVGDYTVFSFARGKPVTLAGGGLLVASGDVELPTVAPSPGRGASARALVTASSYDLLITRPGYALVERLGLGGVGQTVLDLDVHPGAMDHWRAARIATQAARYLRAERPAQAALLAGLGDDRTMLPCVDLEGSRLLRFPVLVKDRPARDAALTRLRDAGFGATAMYGRALMDIDGVAACAKALDAGSRARAFADRLLTLPCHGDVTARDATTMIELLAT